MYAISPANSFCTDQAPSTSEEEEEEEGEISERGSAASISEDEERCYENIMLLLEHVVPHLNLDQKLIAKLLEKVIPLNKYGNSSLCYYSGTF